jgi:hypothetical protein
VSDRASLRAVRDKHAPYPLPSGKPRSREFGRLARGQGASGGSILAKMNPLPRSSLQKYPRRRHPPLPPEVGFRTDTAPVAALRNRHEQ